MCEKTKFNAPRFHVDSLARRKSTECACNIESRLPCPPQIGGGRLQHRDLCGIDVQRISMVKDELNLVRKLLGSTQL
jgi:hypothetical protein